MLTVFGSPSRYVQGAHATGLLGQEVKKLGIAGHAFIIAGHSARSLLSGTWMETFQSAGIMHSIFNFGGQCSNEEINRAAFAARDAEAKVIIGAGGGKVLDTARAVADKLNVPVVNCPTVASSDAPCSALSVIYTKEGEFQEYRFYKQNPLLVLVDTAVIARSPARLLTAGIGDALATWFEAKAAIASGKSNQLGGRTTIAAAALAELCYKTLIADSVAALESLQAQTVTPELERLVEANTLLSGLGFESGGLALAHSVHNGLTVAHETHPFYHGEKVAFGTLVQLIAEGQPPSLLEEVSDFSVQVGLPVTLSDIGLVDASSDVLMKVASRAVVEGETAHNEPFPVTAELVYDAIRKADRLGKEAKRSGSRSESREKTSV